MPVVAHEAKQYTRISVAPLTGALGAEVSGVQLRDFDDEVKAELHDAWLEHKVLFFRDQELTRDEHVAYGRRWGSLEQHPFTPNEADHPEIVVLESTPEKFYAAEAWHSDVTWRALPVAGLDPARDRRAARRRRHVLGEHGARLRAAARRGQGADRREAGCALVREGVRWAPERGGARAEAPGVPRPAAPGRAHPSRDRPALACT